MTDPIDPYQIIITDEDMPHRMVREEDGKPVMTFPEEMVAVTVMYPKRVMRRIDRASANIGTARANTMRAIMRQAIENEAAVIVTKWGQSHVV